ncbi:hypothetical protein HAX54_018741 [Datura stramonium]|uniref:Uncharacterized protein n=1 Tax=Datura stramonium TaxID=4076 RepID=A0ABS8UPZ8_DATST|nr:hypothetical protein [Datura stramonium]
MDVLDKLDGWVDETSIVSSKVVVRTWNLKASEIMSYKFQTTRGGARRSRDLRNENTDCEGESQEVGTNAPSPSYQTRFAARQQAANPQSDEGNDNSADGSSSSSDNPNSD